MQDNVAGSVGKELIHTLYGATGIAQKKLSTNCDHTNMLRKSTVAGCNLLNPNHKMPDKLAKCNSIYQAAMAKPEVES